jgi:hypothetical protein
MLYPIIEPLRVTPIDTKNSEGEKIGSETILLEGTTDPENPRVPSQQAISLVIILSQQEIQRTSGEEGVSNTLYDLITIYDDEESSEVSLITPVPITKEKEPGGTSTPILYASIPNPLQGDHEAESTL